ncbi:hypothetical protein HOR75_gp49 [Shewanella phage SppYZU05]|uniref:Uncharacterized protein n=1 Tax=Shewanella phage SppYZU05 TaxID=1970795 RepID=A0A1W6JTN4_9CAUD|nr:hypothetical protein HOR75_gp49 [Shewanella phage SppYZU05]ARM70575.1 hypothetical protein SppYZU05_49 [Shewanella phage SppYZU05]
MTFEEAETVGELLTGNALTPLPTVGATLEILGKQVTVVASGAYAAKQNPCQNCEFRNDEERCEAAPRCAVYTGEPKFVHFVATKDFHNPYRFVETE